MLVGKRMTQEPMTAEPNELLIRASHKMQSGGFRRLPVVSDGKLVGIVSPHRVTGFLQSYFEKK